MDPIKHVIVLMMENRSFDQMVGFLGIKNKNIDGIDKKRFNIDTRNGSKVFQLPITTQVNDNDPMHEFSNAMDQMKNKNGNFVSDYVTNYPNATVSQVQEVMGYYEDGFFPALHTLAKNFVVCDRWFSSLPGPTWPNRFFVHSGTSLGHVDMPSHVFDPKWHTYDQTTIFDLLEEKKISWKIYFDGIPQSLALLHQLAHVDKYVQFTDFTQDCQNEKDFPSYVFIEPDYSGADENDQHPPSNIVNGDLLIGKVYNSIRSNPELWNTTLLIVLYDENGGFFDHVSPPATVAPDGNTNVFNFDVLGYRVPAILISPYLQKGVDHTEYDHTSILKYLCDKWNLDPFKLGARTPLSNSFGNLFANKIVNNGPVSVSIPVAVKSPTREMSDNSHEDALITYAQYLTNGKGIDIKDLQDTNALYDKAYDQTLKVLKK